MTIIEINKKFYTIPTCWNELSQAQLLQVMDTLFVSQYTGEQALLKLLKILCGMNYFQFFRSPVDQLSEFLYLTTFLYTEQELTNNLIPEYFHKGEKYYGPAAGFDNLVMEEFAHTEFHFESWWNDKENFSHLDNLVACLYRPAKKGYDHKRNPDGDPRQPFNEKLCSWNAIHAVRKWPLNVKLAIATWYGSCHRHLVSVNPEVFSGGGGEAPLFGLVSVIRNVAKGGVFGNFKEVEKQYVHLVMIELNEVVQENKLAEKAATASK